MSADTLRELEAELERKRMLVLQAKADITARLEEHQRREEELTQQIRATLGDEKRRHEASEVAVRARTNTRREELEREVATLKDRAEKLATDEELTATALVRLSSSLAKLEGESAKRKGPIFALRDLIQSITEQSKDALQIVRQERLARHASAQPSMPLVSPRHPNDDRFNAIQEESCVQSLAALRAAESMQPSLRHLVDVLKQEFETYATVIRLELEDEERLVEERAAQTSALEAASAFAGSMNDELEALEKEFESTRAAIEVLEKERARNDLAASEDSLRDQEKLLREAEKRADASRSANNAASEEVADLQHTLQRHRADLEDARKDQSLAEQRCRQRALEAEQARTELRGLEQRLKETKDRQASLERDLVACTRKASEGASAVAASEGKLQQARSALADTESRLKCTAMEADDVSAALKAREAELLEAREAEAALKREIAAAATDELQRSIALAERRLADVKALSAERRQELAYLQSIRAGSRRTSGAGLAAIASMGPASSFTANNVAAPKSSTAVAGPAPAPVSRTHSAAAEYLESLGSSPEIVRASPSVRSSRSVSEAGGLTAAAMPMRASLPAVSRVGQFQAAPVETRRSPSVQPAAAVAADSAIAHINAKLGAILERKKNRSTTFR